MVTITLTFFNQSSNHSIFFTKIENLIPLNLQGPKVLSWIPLMNSLNSFSITFKTLLIQPTLLLPCIALDLSRTIFFLFVPRLKALLLALLYTLNPLLRFLTHLFSLVTDCNSAFYFSSEIICRRQTR